MPLFDYECKSCEHILLDVLQRMGEEPLLYCPECTEPQLTKRMGTATFILKGEGWYAPSKQDNDK